MNLMIVTAFLAQAGTPQPAQPNPGPGDLLRGPLVPMLIMMAGLFYIMHRSQSKKAKDHANLLKTLRSGDKIVTTGGVVGVVVTVKEKTVSIRSADTKMEVLKSAVSEITERGGEANAS